MSWIGLVLDLLYTLELNSFFSLVFWNYIVDKVQVKPASAKPDLNLILQKLAIYLV